MTDPILAAVQHSLSGLPLSFSQAEQFFSAVVKGDVEPVHLTALLVALKMRGETADEIAGAASALRSAATKFPQSLAGSIDCCGTGGDGSNTINISTTAAIVAASMGLPVAKHGNRAITSKCGSADVLAALGHQALDKGLEFGLVPAGEAPALRRQVVAQRAGGIGKNQRLHAEPPQHLDRHAHGVRGHSRRCRSQGRPQFVLLVPGERTAQKTQCSM